MLLLLLLLLNNYILNLTNEKIACCIWSCGFWTFVMKVADKVSDKPKHVVTCMALKRCVW